ncbi:uncharacterized protein LOC125551595 [Triticum urartu]|uniref:uncharacterized protein LOC125551595 n=1 Tax=Triticum urartu TaxID=4572 RepID=UPI002044A754|nr:uncharacterized protein LOC125551595 [Triticum urartu]
MNSKQAQNTCCLDQTSPRRRKGHLQLGSRGRAATTQRFLNRAMLRRHARWIQTSVAASQDLMEKICSDIKVRVEGPDKSPIVEFKANLPSFDPSPDKYDRVPGVILKAPDITEESQRDLFLYGKQHLQTIHGLASDTKLDKPMFIEKIDKLLARWEKLFSAQFSEGMEQMVEALKDLRELLVGDSAPLLPFNASAVAAQKTKVQEALNKAPAIKEAIPVALAKIEEVEIAAKIKCAALTTSMKHQE